MIIMYTVDCMEDGCNGKSVFMVPRYGQYRCRDCRYKRDRYMTKRKRAEKWNFEGNMQVQQISSGKTEG